MPDAGRGRILTFYSYKGGTGRTMALANMGWILASNGYRVLVVDWDLEAPGLHRYFHPFLSDKSLASTKGVIDMVFDYQRAVLELPNAASLRELPREWYDKHVNIFRYVTELNSNQLDFPELHLLPAGQQTAQYGPKVNKFNWEQLYKNLGGFEFVEAVKRQMCAEYDYVLVDSRTGVSDTSSLCTVQLPDALIVCFTLNSQSIDGAGEVAKDVLEQRASEAEAGTFRIFPLPCRLEKAEKQKLDLARDAARSRFDTFLTPPLSPAERDRYWGRVEIFYEPFYAYEEILAAFADKPGVVSSLLASVERLTGYVSSENVTRMQPISESVRQEVLALYERKRDTADDPVRRAAAALGRFTTEEADIARHLLLRSVTPGIGGTVIRHTLATGDVDAEDQPILRRLVDEGIFSRKLAEDGETEFVTIADERLTEGWPALRGWVRECEDTLRLRDVLEDQASRWEASGQDPNRLLRRGVVQSAVAAAKDRKLFSARAARFLRESERQTAGQQLWQAVEAFGTRRTAMLLGAIVVAALSAVLGIYYVVPFASDQYLLARLRIKDYAVDGSRYVWIPPGTFQMGCAYDDARADCKYANVRITQGFWLGQTEVTNGAYRRYLAARARTNPQLAGEPADFPVSGVDWLDAVDYCAWVRGRLPTSAEWEYAARAGVSGKRYITGAYDERLVSLGTAPRAVRSYRPNRFGLYDMSANVAEWTSDIPTGFPVSMPRPWEVRAADAHGYFDDPRQPFRPGHDIGFVVRGGSYASGQLELQLHESIARGLSTRDTTIGLRCVIEPTDFERVAIGYRKTPFSDMYSIYGPYHYQTFGWYSPYFIETRQFFWNTVYLRYMDERRTPAPGSNPQQ